MWKYEELEKQLDEYFENVTPEQLMKDLEETECLPYMKQV